MPVVVNAPGFLTRFSNDRAAFLRLGEKEFEDQRMAPGHGLLRIADGLIFVGIGIFHQNRADLVGAQRRGDGAFHHPVALIILADVGALFINLAAAAEHAVLAQNPGVLIEMLDREHLAAHCAFAA